MREEYEGLRGRENVTGRERDRQGGCVVSDREDTQTDRH